MTGESSVSPGAIRVKSGTSWERHDKTKLSSAQSIPLYVLATLHGEQKSEVIIDGIHSKNRRMWNGYFCKDMDEAQRRKLAQALNLDEEELTPLSIEEEYLRQILFKERMGFQFEISEEGYNFENLIFPEHVSFRKFVIPFPANFSNAHFAKRVDFGRTQFSDLAIFNKAHFSEDVLFSECNFNEYADFAAAHFVRDASFTDATIKVRADFVNSVFHGDCYFARTLFEAGASFESATFERQAVFHGAHFSEEAQFAHASFHNFADFDAARFDGRSEFSNGRFVAKTRFPRAQFLNDVPAFFETDFHQDTIFPNQKFNWPVGNGINSENGKQAYRRLRQISAELHNPEDEHFFLRQEMACDAHIKTGLSRWIVKGFGIFSDYGYSVWRPILGLGGLVFGGAILMLWFSFAWAYVFGTPPEGMSEVPGMFDAVGLSIANTFSIFGFRSYYFGSAYMVSLPAVIKLIGGIQTVGGFILLFFLGLGLRNRFRLK